MERKGFLVFGSVSEEFWLEEDDCILGTDVEPMDLKKGEIKWRFMLKLDWIKEDPCRPK